MRESGHKYPNGALRKRQVPIPTTGYIVKDEEFEKLPLLKKDFLSREGIEVYMSIVGSFIWIQGVRIDIIFAILYLTWFTKAPRQHHLDMAYYCMGYLANTIEIPLVLGGNMEKRVIGYSDASLATGPQCRSITAEMIRLNEHAAATHRVPLSSFEAELDAATNMIKSEARVMNTLTDMGVQVARPSLLYSDNLAMINFVKGEGTAKGARHTEMRSWYTRDEFNKGNFEYEHMAGVKIPPDKMTKLGGVSDQRVFTRDVMGLNLVGEDFMKFED
jgi:hypothetical protein